MSPRKTTWQHGWTSCSRGRPRRRSASRHNKLNGRPAANTPRRWSWKLIPRPRPDGKQKPGTESSLSCYATVRARCRTSPLIKIVHQGDRLRFTRRAAAYSRDGDGSRSLIRGCLQAFRTLLPA
jgi:hypothetical protein